MGKGTNTVTQNSAPPSQVLQAYQNLIGQATNVANTPYQQYSGQLLAPMNTLQDQGITTLAQLQGYQQPYLQGATGYAEGAASGAAGLGNLGSQISQYGVGQGQQLANYGVGLQQQGPQFQQFGPQTLNQYMSPYNNSVIQATENQFNNQNAIQSQNLLGSAIQTGNAFGGDRAGVAQAALAGQQQTAEAPVIAGLENQNYAQALQQYNTNQQQALAGGQLGLGALGTGAQLGLTGQTTGAGLYGNELGVLQGAGYQMGQLGQESLMGAEAAGQGALTGGTLQQQQEQAGLNIPYSQFLQSQAYPFQTTGWLGGLTEGIGSLSGGQSSTTGPSPSILGQAAGLGIAGLGIAGSPLGGYIGSGLSSAASGVGSWLSSLGALALAKRGGRLGYAGGGVAPSGMIPYQPIQLPDMSGTPQTASPLDGIQTAGGVRGSGPPRVPNLPAQSSMDSSNPLTSFDSIMNSVSKASSGWKNIGTPNNKRGGLIGSYDDGGTIPASGSLPGVSGAQMVITDPIQAAWAQAQAADASAKAQGLARGGYARRFDDGGGVTPGFEDLVQNYDHLGLGQEPDWTTFQQNAPALAEAGAKTGPDIANSPELSANETGLSGPSMGGVGAINAAIRSPTHAGLPYADDNLDPHPQIKEEDGEKVVQHKSDGTKIYTGLPADGTGNQTIASSPWMGLVAAGLGMMASKSPFPGVAIGEGGLQGLQYLQGQQQFDINRQKSLAEIARQNIETQTGQFDLGLRQQMLGSGQSDASPVGGVGAAVPGSGLISPTGTPTIPMPAGVISTPNGPMAVDANNTPLMNIPDMYSTAQKYVKLGAVMKMPALASYGEQMLRMAQGFVDKGAQPNVAGGAMPVPGSAETAARAEGIKTSAEEQARSQYRFKEIQPQAGGPTMWVRESDLPQATANHPDAVAVGPGAGSAPGSAVQPPNAVIAKQPAFIAVRQEQIAKDENTMTDQFQARQLARQRLQALADIMQKYQTGAFASQKADIQAALRSIGIPIQDTDTMNAAAFQQFTKNAIANVFDSVKGMGGRVLVSEIQGLTKANANPEMQPGANQAIVGQALGILNYEDKHYNDYFDWKSKNPNAYDTSPFERQFVTKNPIGTFVDAAERGIGARGIPIPANPAERINNQVYVGPNGKAGRWMGDHWETP